MPPDRPDDSGHAAKRVGRLHFGAAGYGTPDPKPAPPPPTPPSTKSAPTPTSTPTPESLEHAERRWLEALERESAKIPSLADAFHPGRPATPAEISAVVAHARQIERWYAGFLPAAQKLAAHGHTRLIERVNIYLSDMRATCAIYEKLERDARASQDAMHATMTASNQDTYARLGAMHVARQSAFDEANALWAKTFTS